MLALRKQTLSRAIFFAALFSIVVFQSPLAGKICEQRDQSKALTIRFNDYGEQKIGRHQGSYFYTKDHLGSVRELVGWWGTLQAQYDYSPYGRRHELYSNQGRGTTVGFTGHYRHWVGGIMLAKHRAYFPNIGRWLSPDPLGETGPDGANVYAYVRGNPVNYVDPTGEFAVLPFLWAGFAAFELGQAAYNAYQGNWGAAATDLVFAAVPGVGQIKAGVKACKVGKSLSEHKKALKLVHGKVGRLPKGKPGRFGSPQAGNSRKGYRLDPPHPRATPGSPESKPHINWWDYTAGKRGKGGRGGRGGAISIGK